MDIYLQTERLILRRFTRDDVDNLVDLDSDPEVMRYLSGGTPTPRNVIENLILPRFLHSYERFPGLGYWAAIDRSTGAFLGWFCFSPPAEGRAEEVELGYRLRREAWGKGLATEGSRALIEKGFAELGVERVYANAYEENTASRRVMEKSGLRFVRSYRLSSEVLAANGTFAGDPDDVWQGEDVEYALERAEWEQSYNRRKRSIPP